MKGFILDLKTFNEKISTALKKQLKSLPFEEASGDRIDIVFYRYNNHHLTLRRVAGKFPPDHC